MLGGMGITNPIEIANEEHENFIESTKSTTKMIKNQDKFVDTEEYDTREIKKLIAKEGEKKQIELKSTLDIDLTENERRKTEICGEPGASNWLTALPPREGSIIFNKQELKRCYSNTVQHPK